MDENFKTLLFLVCTVSLSMVVFNVLQWLTRVEGKLNLNLIRNSALRVEQYYRMREEIEKEENNKDESQKDNRLVTERIKTFEDARSELGSAHPLVEEYETITCRCGGLSTDILAYMKLRIICTALNEGWEPQFTKSEWRYFPWFVLYTQEEIDDMDEDEKSRVVYRSHYYACAGGGVACADAGCGASGAGAVFGSRLAFKSRELAIYAGKQFIELYADLNFRI